jgi:hypothetical protein
MVEKSCDTCKYMANHALMEPCLSCKGDCVNYVAIHEKAKATEQKIDARFIGIDYDRLNKEIKDMRDQIERLQSAINGGMNA